MVNDRVVAIGLLTQRDLDRIGHSLSAIVPVPSDGALDDLLRQLDTIEVERFGSGMVLRSTRRNI